ncbi:hypothetical protein [Planktothrix agardhii]|jgi:hypothetical protein|uniref:hypothetical protein n=1 Tax=Planktothrix agardhii TaxID=1160 RepID=UPI001F47CDD3|nr:hypothetical protein [Planktothrix agardhii]MCF3574144.1 hypothetical protein [Planktothrix agardhii 1812]MCF3574419.1 hypothetical protein [Planktothrix agardhii 1812]MCF3581764.1 hypothetical protein [Planktothrix agardhii 1811]
MNTHFNTIDPNQSNLSDLAVIEKVISEEDRLPDPEHEKAAKAFLLSDSIASGIARDFAFVKKIPQYIKEIIENKLWECLYVAKGVVTPYYCRYTKGTDSENFRAFITAKRPNGLETTIEEVDNLLNSDLEVQRQFRTLIYESRQGERTDLIDDETSPTEWGKLKHAQQEYLRAANRAAEAIPVIGELLNRGLMSIKVAALLGRDIKDLNNLTAEERDYVDKRDLVGVRINQYIHTNPIPNDEDKEPPYSRELNRYIRELLGVKDRSKPIRMDNPKKAAEKLLQFYQGDRLKELINHLSSGLELPTESPEQTLEKSSQNKQSTNNNQLANVTASPTNAIERSETTVDNFTLSPNLELPALKPAEDIDEKTAHKNLELTLEELAKRLKRKPASIQVERSKNPTRFTNWTKQRDPEGIGWQSKKRGRSVIYIPAPEPKQE